MQAKDDPLWPSFQLGDWRVDVSLNRVQRGTEQRALRHKAMALLVLLARQPGQTVSREQIEQSIWQGNAFVAPKAINTAVWTIRQALGDDPDAPRYVETIAKKGYRLIAPVQALAPAPPAATPPRRHAALLGLGLGLALCLALALAVLRGRAPPPSPASTALAAPVPPRQVEALTQEPGIEYLGQLSPDGRQLAYTWWRGRGAGEIYLRTPGAASAPARAFSGDAGDVQGLAWSPDARAIAYSAAQPGQGCTLWLQPLQGERRALAACSALFTPNVAWSPDGRHIAFSAEREGVGGLFLISPDGSGLRRLSAAPPGAMPDHQPAWSSDSRRLAFAREDPADGTRDLFEATLDGSVQRLSQLRLHYLHGLTYAADGQDLLLSTTVQDVRTLQRWQRASGQLLPLGLDGSAPQRAADGSLVYALLRGHVSLARLNWGGAPERLLRALASDRMPRLSPDARRIAFVSRRSGHPELWLAQADGSQAQALTRLQGLLRDPVWQPNGAQLAFLGHCGPGKRPGLCLVAAAGGEPRALVSDAAAYGRPVWHPTRPELWVSSDRGGRWQLWRFPLDGSAPEPQPSAEPPGAALHWRADGQALVYQPLGARHLQWRNRLGVERRLEPVSAGEELLDWQLQGGSVLALLRSDRERWRRIDLQSGARQSLGEHPLGSFPERARFDLWGDAGVLVEVVDTESADIMRAR